MKYISEHRGELRVCDGEQAIPGRPLGGSQSSWADPSMYDPCSGKAA